MVFSRDPGFSDGSLFIACGKGGGGGSGAEDLRRILRGGGNPKGGITENFGRIQRGDHSNLLIK